MRGAALKVALSALESLGYPKTPTVKTGPVFWNQVFYVFSRMEQKTHTHKDVGFAAASIKNMNQKLRSAQFGA